MIPAYNRVPLHLISLALGIATGVFILVATTFMPQFASILILAVLLSFVAIGLGQGKKLLLLVILFEIPIQIDIYLRYREGAVLVNALPGLNISITTIALAILYTLWLVELLARSTTFPSRLLRLSLPSLTYLGLVGLSILVASDAELAAFEISLLIQAVLLFIYVAYAIRTRQDLTFFMTVLLIALVVESLIMIGLYAVGQSVRIGIILARIDPSGRVGGTIGSPNNAASFLTMLLAPALGLFLAKVGRGLRSLAMIAFSLGIIALMLTFSRGGWTGFVISIIVFTFLAWRRGMIGLKIPLAVAVLVMIVVFVLREPILGRLTSDQGAALSRVPLIQIALQMILENIFLGVGANNFAVNLPDFVTPDFSSEWLTTVHNKYLLVWSETGVVGLLAFLWFLLSSIRGGYRVWQKNDPLLSPIALGFTAALSGFMVHMLFDLFHSRPQTTILWLVAGILAALTSIAQLSGDTQPAHSEVRLQPAPTPASSSPSLSD